MSSSDHPEDVSTARSSVPPGGLALSGPKDGSAEIRERLREEGWATDSRADRRMGWVAIAANLALWLVDLAHHGLSPVTWVLLGVQATAAALAVPFLLSARASRASPALERNRLIGVIAAYAGMLASMSQMKVVLPEHVAIFLTAMTLGGLGARMRLRHALAVNLVAYVLFAVVAVGLFRARGLEYSPPAGLAGGLLGTLFAAVVLPFVPHRVEQHRERELLARMKLESEVLLREQRERELVARERELVDEKRRAERALRDARRAAAESAQEARLRTELFANMSHDLRTPMAGILGLVDLLAGTSLSPEQAGYIETIRASNQTLLSLLDDVIDFSRLEEGKLPITLVPAPLVDTLMRPVGLLRVTAERKELELAAEIDPGLPPYVRLDPARVQQIVFNLVGNALKFTPQGKVTLKAAARRDPEGALWLRVDVIDTGIGFTEEQRDRLWRRFSQADEGIVHKFGGSGLGLSICRGLVELMGGKIGADGAPGRGAHFWFEIPTEETRAPSGADPGGELPSLRVLLAEDNPVNQLVVSLMLKKLGQEVIVASDGEQALRLLLQERFHLAILDMQMPVMDGLELTRRIRNADARAGLTYVVALSASATVDDRDRFLRAGVDAVYAKPIDMERLRRMLIKEGNAARARHAELAVTARE